LIDGRKAAQRQLAVAVCNATAVDWAVVDGGERLRWQLAIALSRAPLLLIDGRKRLQQQLAFCMRRCERLGRRQAAGSD
jgi:hypothetical protein